MAVQVSKEFQFSVPNDLTLECFKNDNTEDVLARKKEDEEHGHLGQQPQQQQARNLPATDLEIVLLEKTAE